MKHLIVIAGVSLALVGCARQDDTYDAGSSPVIESGSLTETNAVPNASGSMTPTQPEQTGGPDTPDRAAATAVGGEAAPIPSNIPPGESETPATGTEGQTGEVNTHDANNPGSSIQENSEPTR